MSASIHGHDVMQMMIDAKTPFTRQTLKESIIKKFGPNARFHTCSAENMTPEELIDFLTERGKFVENEGGEGFSTNPDKICNH